MSLGLTAQCIRCQRTPLGWAGHARHLLTLHSSQTGRPAAGGGTGLGRSQAGQVASDLKEGSKCQAWRQKKEISNTDWSFKYTLGGTKFEEVWGRD